MEFGLKSTVTLTMATILTACTTVLTSPYQDYFENDNRYDLHLDRMARRDAANCDAQYADITPESLGLIRVPPQIPAGADTSGFCDVTINLNPKGEVSRINLNYCSATALRKETLIGVGKWGFTPKDPSSTLSACNIRQRVGFMLKDDKGNIIPMPYASID